MELEKKMDLEAIEKRMLSLPQVECPVVHSFGPGLYIRELRMATGTLAMGHEQKFEHINILAQGKILMLNDDGSKTILEAPKTFVGKPGRKVGYVLEDIIWFNVYPTDETDIEKLENMYVEKSDTWEENKKLTGGKLCLS